MSKIPRFDRNSSVGVPASSGCISSPNPNQRTKIPLPISPRKSTTQLPSKSNLPVYPDTLATSPPTSNHVPHLQLEHTDIRDISTPSHFHDDDSELDALSPMNSVDIPHSQHTQEAEVEPSISPQDNSPAPDCSTPVSPPPHIFESQPHQNQSSIHEIISEADKREVIQDPAPIDYQSYNPDSDHHTHSSPLSADLIVYPVETDPLYSPDVTLIPHPPSYPKIPTSPPSAFSRLSPDLSRHAQYGLEELRQYPPEIDTHFLPISGHSMPPPLSDNLYELHTISNQSQWTIGSPIHHPMLPPLSSPPFHILSQDNRDYYHLRASTDSLDLTSVSYGTPMDTPSPIPSLLSTPDDKVSPDNFLVYADTDGLSHQLTALREALDESTRERARLVNIIQEQEHVRSPNRLTADSADFNKEIEQLRIKCMDLESENFKLSRAVSSNEESADLQEATRARDMLASEFEQLKAYQLHLEEELRVEREKNILSPTSLVSHAPLLELETVKLDNTQLRDRIAQLNEEQNMRISAEQEVQRLRLQLQEEEQSTKLRLKENESYFLTQLEQEQDNCNRLRQANKQLAQELNEQDSSKRIIQSELQSVRKERGDIEEELLTQQTMNSDLKQQLRGRDEILSELEMKQGQQVELDVLDTLKREIERLKVEKEGVELKLTQEMQQTLQYMEAKKTADEEITRLNRELQRVERDTQNGNTQDLNEALEAAHEANQNLTNELEMRKQSFVNLKENLTLSVTDKRQLESDYSLLEQSHVQLRSSLQNKVQECLILEREIANLQVDASIALEKANSQEDSKQALSTLISLLSQIISELALAVKFSEADHQCLTQEMESLFDQVSCSVSEENSYPQAFENLRNIIQKQAVTVQQLIADQSRIERYTEEAGVLKNMLQKLEGNKLCCEEKILELLANNASLQTKVNFNTTHTNKSEPLTLSQMLPHDVFALLNQNPRQQEDILQSQLELTGESSPQPDTPDYFSGEMREMRRELRESRSLIINLKQDLVKSHGCIVSLQLVNNDVTQNSNALESIAETAESELQRLRGEIEDGKIERIHSNAQKMDRINMLVQVLESVCNKVTQDNKAFCVEFSKLARFEQATDQSELSDALQQSSNSTDTPQLITLVDTVLSSRHRVISILLQKASQICDTNKLLEETRVELLSLRNVSDNDRAKLTEFSELNNTNTLALSEEKSKSQRLVNQLKSEQEGRKLLDEELQDRERIVLSLRHELEQERFLHKQQCSDKENSLSTQVDELKEKNTQQKRDWELLNNRMQHLQITSSNQVEQLNAQLYKAQTEVTRLEGVNTKLSDSMKLDTNTLTQLSSTQANEVEALSLELTQNKTEVIRCHDELETQRNHLADKEQMLLELVRNLDELREKKQAMLSEYENLQDKKLTEVTQRAEQLEHKNIALSEENSRLKNTFETEIPSILEGNKEERAKLQKFIEDLSNKNGQLTQSLAEIQTELSRSKHELSRLSLTSEEQFERVMRNKRDLEEELGKLKQEYTLDIISLQGEIPIDLLNIGEELDIYSTDSEHVSLPNLIRKLCQENKELKMRYHDLETSILEGRTDSLPGTSTPDIQDHSDIVYFKKPQYIHSDSKPSDKLLRTKKKQLELLRLKLGYTLRELRMYKVLKSAYDQQIDDLKRLLSESGDKYEGCIQKITELEQLCFRDD
ncbi:hypothetical protein LOD99_2590 [Oopsacas minuta]|uniref:Uncharacterized protein n=1 Tax=Oopsacas minuta TaxID=111878 RepID=A0AAV7K0M4_9METZ|nr:hypothetical protein LOD99_2590 [Oopsacas minuta]